MSLSEFIDDVARRARDELAAKVDVRDVSEFPDRTQIPSSRRTWCRIEDVVALVADLKGSTKLGVRRYASSVARTYEAITGCGVEIVEAFEPDFVDIQGDGIVALFHGTLAYEHAFCAALTLRTFSERELVPALAQNMPDGYPLDTGLKTGLAASTLLVKSVGAEWKEPIWAGKAVNHAAKCAQAADAHELIVTRPVYDLLKANDFIRYSCRCISLAAKLSGTAPHGIWEAIDVRSLGEKSKHCCVLRRPWCESCGDEFCAAILAGERERSDAPGWLLR